MGDAARVLMVTMQGNAFADDAQGDEARQKVDFLGGDLFCSLLAQLRFPLPVPAMAALGMYGHVFANAGNAVLLTGPPRPPAGGAAAADVSIPRPPLAATRARLGDSLQEFKRTWRLSAVREALISSSPTLAAVGLTVAMGWALWGHESLAYSTVAA
jgi:hypothetical protein